WAGNLCAAVIRGRTLHSISKRIVKRRYIRSERAMLLFLFWASIAIIGYTFAGYPLTLALWGAVRPRSWRREPYEPAVSVVIAAHNEAGFMSQKIRNLIALDYPADRLEILIG